MINLSGVTSMKNPVCQNDNTIVGTNLTTKNQASQGGGYLIILNII